jgi:DNA polymerase V
MMKSKSAVVIPISNVRAVCGLFGISEDTVEKFQSLDARFIKNKASTFFFEAASNSMEPFIFEKDVLIVDRSIEPTSGCIAVLNFEGDMICKRIIYTDQGMCLRSENPEYTDIQLTDGMDMTVFGVVTGLARDIR